MTRPQCPHCGKFLKRESEVDRKEIRRNALDRLLMDEVSGIWHIFMRLAKNPKPEEIYHCRAMVLDLYRRIVRGDDAEEG
jgi:hypothetical protein